MNIFRGFLFLVFGCFLAVGESRATSSANFDLKIETAVQVSFQTETGKLYQIESSPDVPSPTWTAEGKTILGDANRFQATFLSGGNSRTIYRVEELVLTNGLVGYYPFNGNANDESGSGNGAIVTGARFGTNRFGILQNSCDLGTPPFSIITTNSAGFPTGNGDFTVSLWVKLASEPPAANQILFCNLSLAQFQLVISPNDPVGNPTPSSLGFLTGGPGHNDDCETPSLDWTPGKWYSVQVVRSANSISIYRDGNLLAQTTTSFGNEANSEENNLQFGNRGGSLPFTGQLDDFRIYERALSGIELKALREIVE